MKELNLITRKETTKVVLYGSIKELPIHVSKKLQGFMLQATGIGNTIADIDERLERLMLFISSDKRNEAIEEAKNLRFSLFTTVSEMDFKSLGFACLVHSVNDVQTNDYSQEGLNALVDRLSNAGLTTEKVVDILDDVKKNLIPNANYISLPSLEQI